MEIKEIDNCQAVVNSEPLVCILTYTAENEILSSIGIINELNPHFPGNRVETVIIGKMESEDISCLQRAMIELKKCTGIEITDSLKWTYLGEMYMSKYAPDSLYVFVVNISDMKIDSDTFKLKNIEEALQSKDALLHAIFFKFFLTYYHKQIKDA